MSLGFWAGRALLAACAPLILDLTMTTPVRFRLAEKEYARTLSVGRSFRPYFRPTYHGLSNLEGLGGALLAANHGLFGMELLALLIGVDDAFGRPVRALADELLFRTPPQRAIMRSMGVCVGRPEIADTLLARGELVYVCPGGAREALASKSDRYKLFWDGHFGFVRTALRNRTPIVPLAIVGIDEIYRQVLDGEALRATLPGQLIQRYLGDKYVLPIYAGLGPMPFPQALEFHFGAPIATDIEGYDEHDQALVERLHEATRVAVETMLADALTARASREASLRGPEALFVKALRTLAG